MDYFLGITSSSLALVELEEKDEIHLKCPEDTTSIGSNSVSTLTVYLVDD